MSDIEVFYQDAAELQADVSVRYVKSGLEDIKYYVSTTIKPELDNYEENVIQAKIDAYTEEKRIALNGYLEQAQGYAFSAAEKANNAQLSAVSAASSAEQASKSLGHYYTKTQVDTTLANYVTTTALGTTLADYQTKANLVTSLSSASTDTQYPSAKCVYDIIGDVESLLNNINSGS